MGGKKQHKLPFSDIAILSISSFHIQRSLVLMGFLTAFGSVIGIYIMVMAVLSPCPLLVNHISGAILIVS